MNLLDNAGFERPAPGHDGPAAWNPNTQEPGSTLQWDSATAHSGRHSVRIDSTQPTDIAWVQTIAVQPHTAYRLTGWIRTRNVTYPQVPDNPNGGAFAAVMDAWDRSVPILATRNWTQVGVVVVTGEQTQLTVAARLGFFSGVTAGTAWFDDFDLARIPDTGQVVNGGLEQGFPQAGSLPRAWDPFNGPSMTAFGWDPAVSHSGRRSVRVRLTDPGDAMWTQTVRVEPHTRYQVSGWIKTLNVAHTAQSEDAGANLSFWFTWDHSTPVLGTQDWTYVSAVTDSGDGRYLTVAARLGFWSGVTTGTAWFDDLTITRLS